MPRTIRTKVYKFNELSKEAKEKALYDKVRQKHRPIDIRNMSNSMWINLLSEAKAFIIANDYEFTKEGNIFNY